MGSDVAKSEIRRHMKIMTSSPYELLSPVARWEVDHHMRIMLGRKAKR